MDLDAEFKKLRLWQADVNAKLEELSNIKLIAMENRNLRAQIEALAEKVSALEPEEVSEDEPETKVKKGK